LSQRLPATRSSLALLQGSYFALTGLWGLLHDRSFQWVTGPKTDVWLLKTVSVLVTTIGGTLALAGVARRPTPEIGFMAAASAAGLMAIDCYYVARRRISPVYLLDAIAEAGIVAAWIALSRNGSIRRS
jgi:hypothetical protein